MILFIIANFSFNLSVGYLMYIKRKCISMNNFRTKYFTTKIFRTYCCEFSDFLDKKCRATIENSKFMHFFGCLFANKFYDPF